MVFKQVGYVVESWKSNEASGANVRSLINILMKKPKEEGVKELIETLQQEFRKNKSHS